MKTTLDKCPPELSGDIMDRGIVLAGGGANLRGLDERLRHETGMPILIADNPLHSVAIGSGRCVEDFEALQQVLVSERKLVLVTDRGSAAMIGPTRGQRRAVIAAAAALGRADHARPPRGERSAAPQRRGTSVVDPAQDGRDHAGRPGRPRSSAGSATSATPAGRSTRCSKENAELRRQLRESELTGDPGSTSWQKLKLLAGQGGFTRAARAR